MLALLVSRLWRRSLATLGVLLTASALANAGTFLAFGPNDYVRPTGEPVTVTDTFSVLNPSTQYTLKAFNGGLENSQTELVSSTIVTVNGVQVIGANNFNQNVTEVDVPVTLQSSNTISVKVRGKPAGKLTIEIIGVDNDVPTITAAISPSPNAAGWNNTNVTVTFTCADATSGVASCTQPQTLTADGANQVISGTATDKAGNTASTSITVNLDKTPPTIEAAPSPFPNAAGWNNTDVTVAFTCSDSISGVVSCPQLGTVTSEGANQTVSGTVRDVAGNTASASLTVSLDKTPPAISATVSPMPNAAGWNNTNPTVTFSCSDSTSGVANCPSPQTISSEVAGLVVSGVVTDIAGNTASTSVTVNLDKTPPVLSITSPANGSSIALSTSSIGITGSDTDSVSGITSVTCNGTPAVLSGSGFTCTITLTQGANSISVQAADVAGNVATSPLNLTYNPAPQITIASPTNLSVTNLSPVTVNGTVSDPAAAIVINGISVPQSSGSFSIPVPLVEGLNVLSVVATNPSGISSTATVQITLDTTPPHITIDTPAGGTTTTASSVTVSGSANDIVVGTVNSQDVQVSVNGIAAQVSNRSYSVPDVPLALGPNTIQATGRDRAGNAVTTSINVVRVLPSQPPAPAIGQAVITEWLNIVSGNNQSGVVGTQLTAPLVASLTDSANRPVPNQTVVFKVAGNDGLISSSGSTPASALVATTDANGQAQVFWKLGQRAGAAINTLQVSSPLAVSPVSFNATGLTGNATEIIVDSGNNQTGVLGQPLPFPFVAIAVDSGHNRVANVPVTFAVKQGDGNFVGAATQTVNTDSNGRAIAVLTTGLQEGINNTVVEATFPNNTGSPAAFAASAKAPGNPADTTISGVVLDNSNNPIPGVTIRLFQVNQGNSNNLPVQIGTPVQTGPQGTFKIVSAPVGSFKLMADGGTVPGPASYPTLEYDMVTIAGTNNTVGMPIYLPALDTVNKLCVDETHGGKLTLPQVPGFSLTVLPGSATFPGGSKQGCITVTPVNGDKVPMTPGFGQQPRFIVTIQPVGTIFNPPAPITLPNADGLPPKHVTEMYSYDHDLGMFIAIGTGVVSDDGSVIASGPGVGVLKAGWHCGGDKAANGHVADCGDCKICTGDQCVADANQDGNSCSKGKGLCCSGNCVQPKVDILINKTTTNTDDLTVLTPPQPLPVQITMHSKPGCKPAHITLEATPNGRITLDKTALDLQDGESAIVKITPVAVSESANDVTITTKFNSAEVGKASMTVVDVKIPDVKNPDTPAGMSNRIPPRVDTSIHIEVTPDLGSSGQTIHVIAKDNNATNGNLTINGTDHQDITKTTDVKLQGIVQTVASPAVAVVSGGKCDNAPGGNNGGKIKLIAQTRGQDSVTSGGFSVAAIPQNWTDTLLGLITPANSAALGLPPSYGIQVQDGWSSDSESIGDLDQVCITENVQIASGATGTLAGVGTGSSSYLIAIFFSVDTHSTPSSFVVSPGGSNETDQTSAFEDFRTGKAGIPMTNTGEKITRNIFFDQNTNSWRITTTKVGATTSANGVSSGAGQPSSPISVTQ